MEEMTHLPGSEPESPQKIITSEGNTQAATSSHSSNPSIKKRKLENTEQLSWIWDHFTRDLTRFEHEEDPQAVCNYCGTLIGCHPVHHTTGGMNYHLGRCRAYPPNNDLNEKISSFDRSTGESQSSSSRAVVWTGFDKVVIMDKLVRMIVIDELPFSFVEGEGFRDFSYSLCPSFEPVSRLEICRGVVELHEVEKALLKDVFAKRSHSVCLTTDIWTSIQDIDFMVLTAHFIDDDWNLQKKIINLCVIDNREGEYIRKLILKCISEWGIKRVLTITVDDTSANDVAINYVKKQLQISNGCVLDGIYMHVRCCAHVLNLIVNEGLNDIHNSVASIRSAVRYVRSTTERLHKFKESLKSLNISDKPALALDLPTRWNSTYLMLEAALKYQGAFELMGEDGDYVSYCNGDTPKSRDWANAKVLVRFLKSFYQVTLQFSCTLRVTSSACFPELINIEDVINEWIKSDDVLLSDMASSIKAKYDMYWGDMSNMNKILIISCVLDPRFKLHFISICFEDMYGGEGTVGLESFIKEVRGMLMQMYDWYSVRRVQSTTDEPIDNANRQQHETGSTGTLRESKMDRHFRKMEAQGAYSTEVDKYLNEAVVVAYHGFDIQDWWKANSVRFKVLSDIARDVFAIPVSTKTSESTFSTAGKILDPFRSSLTTKMVEVLVTTQSWIKSSRPRHVDHPTEMPLEDVDFDDEVIDDMMGISMIAGA